jgi:hypothetical protein
MKHITYAEKSLLVGDEAADVLLKYAAVLGQHNTADRVVLRALGSDGDDVDATFLLGQGAPLMAETSTTQIPEPDNTAAINLMHAAMARLTTTYDIQPEAQPV